MHRRLLASTLMALAYSFNSAFAQTPASSTVSTPAQRIPVILDTDIGDDIDDSWALCELLRSPQFDITLITTTCGKPEYRARLIAKYLTLAGRIDIPIGLGPDSHSGTGEKMAAWISDFKLIDYKGKIEPDGAKAIIDKIHHSPTPVTVLAIGPLQTLGAALRKDPGIAAKANFVGMDGSVYKGYGGDPKPGVEYNVYGDISDAKQVFSAPWKSITITPLDTCGIVSIGGELFEKLRASQDPLVQGLLASHRVHNGMPDPNSLNNSGTCFDTVAVYLADPNNREKFQMEKLKITIADNGATKISPTGAEMAVATGWIDKDGFQRALVDLLLAQP